MYAIGESHHLLEHQYDVVAHAGPLFLGISSKQIYWSYKKCHTNGTWTMVLRDAMDLQFLFMDDNAPCHRTVAAKQLLESRRLAARTLPPVSIRELRLELKDEWAAMPQQLIDTLIPSMGRRCETCLAVRGDHIPY
ncbi:hypothetical protein TNCV_4337501 [Trichonephila clavipes]|nr:hypothetical protein TNCV_4337501 [Trichonephila clavipes]